MSRLVIRKLQRRNKEYLVPRSYELIILTVISLRCSYASISRTVDSIDIITTFLYSDWRSGVEILGLKKSDNEFSLKSFNRFYSK